LLLPIHIRIIAEDIRSGGTLHSQGTDGGCKKLRFFIYKVNAVYLTAAGGPPNDSASHKPVSQSNKKFIARNDVRGDGTHLSGKTVESYTFKGFEAFTAEHWCISSFHFQ
jgi:hypothetical protein